MRVGFLWSVAMTTVSSSVSNSPKTNQDTDYLTKVQYANPDHLRNRIAFYRGCSQNPQGFHDWLFELMMTKIRHASSLLEVGGGTGYIWEEPRFSRIPNDLSMTLTDVSPSYVETMKNTAMGRRPQTAFTVADVGALQFQDEQFDVVLAVHMLYHARDLSETLSELYRVLKPGGILIASTMSSKHLNELDALVSEFDESAVPWGGHCFRKFLLDAGGEALEDFFPVVEKEIHPDQIVVSDSKLLDGYVFSTPAQEVLKGERAEEFCRFTASRISKTSPLRVTKEQGAFIAVKQ